MAKKVGKNSRVKTFSMSDLTGGINLAVAPERLRENECVKLDNFEFDFEGNKLKTRRGLSNPLFSLDNDGSPDNITYVYNDYELNTVYCFTKSKKIYKYEHHDSPKFIGVLNGNDIPACCKFGGALFIASGSHLQRYAGDSVEVIADSPECNIVIERFGRLLVTMSGSDNFVYSGVGDYKMWTENPNDLASSQVIEVGYKDGGDIVGIYPLATDIICFKSNGYIYNVANEPDNWYITLVGKNSDYLSRRAVLNLGNDVVYLSRVGLRSMASSNEYGNFARKDIGEKCNPGIKTRVDRPWLSDLRRSKQLIISGDSRNTVWVYHYAIQAFTTWTFPYPVTSIAETVDHVYVAMENKLYELSWNNRKDYNYKTGKYQGIPQIILSKRLVDTNIMTAYRENIRVKSPDKGTSTIAVNDVEWDWDWDQLDQRDEFKTQIRDFELQFKFETEDPIEMDYFTVDVVMQTEAMVTDKGDGGLADKVKKRKKSRRGGSDPFLENVKKKGKSPYGYV